MATWSIVFEIYRQRAVLRTGSGARSQVGYRLRNRPAVGCLPVNFIRQSSIRESEYRFNESAPNRFLHTLLISALFALFYVYASLCYTDYHVPTVPPYPSRNARPRLALRRTVDNLRQTELGVLRLRRK